MLRLSQADVVSSSKKSRASSGGPNSFLQSPEVKPSSSGAGNHDYAAENTVTCHRKTAPPLAM